MMATTDVRDLLIELAEDLDIFETVVACPASLALSAKVHEDIFKTFPDLKLPACLLVLKVGNDRGSRPERMTDWSWLIIDKDAKGGAEAANMPCADALRGLCGQQIESGKVWIKPDNEFGVAALPDPKWSIMEVAFTTREYHS
jgi:hypothetical protein